MSPCVDDQDLPQAETLPRRCLLKRAALALALVILIAGSAMYTVHAINQIPRCACQFKSPACDTAPKQRPRREVRISEPSVNAPASAQKAAPAAVVDESKMPLTEDTAHTEPVKRNEEMPDVSEIDR